MECFAPYSSCIKVLFKNNQPFSVNKKKEEELLNDYLGAQTWLEFMADKLEEDNSSLKDCLRALEAGFLKGGGVISWEIECRWDSKIFTRSRKCQSGHRTS